MTQPDVLLVGLGGVGSYVLEFIARAPGISHVVAADYQADWGQCKVNTVRDGAALQGCYPHLSFVHLDLNDVEMAANVIGELQPKLILNTATAQTWWVRHRHLSPEEAERLAEAGAGPWLPTHMALAAKLMRAVREAGWQGHVINSGFADASNAVLARNGMAPTMGLGNIDLVVPGVQNEVARRLGMPARTVHVFAVLHHYHLDCFRKSPEGAPRYFVRILAGDRDVTGEFDTNRLFHEVRQLGLSGRHVDPVVAASGVKNTLALLGDTGLLTHTNGPQGLVGGYPVRVGAAGAQLFVPQGITRDEAVAINEEAQRGDGIERIEADGTVVYTAKSVEIMKKVLGYDLKPLRFDELDARCDELVARFQALAKK